MPITNKKSAAGGPYDPIRYEKDNGTVSAAVFG